MKIGPLQLIPHEHSGRLRQHHHTSYAGLAFVLLLCTILVGATSWASWAATPAVNPQSGSVGLTGVVRGPAPTQAAVITSPRSGQHTTTIPITVSGLCPVNTFVLITKNDVFAGGVNCAEDGTFSLQIDLFDGSNRLVARVSDALGQFGPDSAAVEVFYDSPVLTAPGGAIGKQLFLQTNTVVVGVGPNASVARTVAIVGGIGPYAVSWDWGDGTTTLASQANEGSTSSRHTYERPGIYRVIVRVVDSTGNAAFMQLVTVVNGPIETTQSSGGSVIPGALVTAWPLLSLAIFLVLAFWFGERHMVRKLRRQAQSLAAAE
jgi:hypothetical protein